MIDTFEIVETLMANRARHSTGISLDVGNTDRIKYDVIGGSIIDLYLDGHLIGGINFATQQLHMHPHHASNPEAVAVYNALLHFMTDHGIVWLPVKGKVQPVAKCGSIIQVGAGELVCVQLRPLA